MTWFHTFCRQMIVIHHLTNQESAPSVRAYPRSRAGVSRQVECQWTPCSFCSSSSVIPTYSTTLETKLPGSAPSESSRPKPAPRFPAKRDSLFVTNDGLAHTDQHQVQLETHPPSISITTENRAVNEGQHDIEPTHLPSKQTEFATIAKSFQSMSRNSHEYSNCRMRTPSEVG